MVDRHRTTSLAALALAALLSVGFITAAVTPAQATTAPTLTVTPSSGTSDTSDGSVMATQNLGCTGTGTLVDTNLLKGTVTVFDAAEVSAVEAAASANLYFEFTSTGSTTAGDWTSGTTGTFPAGGWKDWGNGHAYTSVGAIATAVGAGAYTLAALCTTAAGAPVLDGSSNPIVAFLPVSLHADGSWTAGVQPDATTATVTAVPVAGGGAALTATIADSATPATIPTGTVQFFADGATTALNTTAAPVDGTGKATFSATATQLPVGTHSVSAVYTPTGTFLTSTGTDSTVAITAGKAGTQVVLVATGTGTEVDLSATVETSDGNTATAAAGTVDFAETTGTGWTKTGVLVTNGIAQTSDTGLTAGTKYTFTATYRATSTEAFTDSAASTPEDATVPAAGTNGALTDGGSVQAGTSYDVTFPAGTFGDGDTIDVVLHSTPTTLTPGTATSTGALDYTFAAPSDLVAGDSHTLVFTDASDSTKTQTIAFTVAATTDPNDPSTFLTDATSWAVSTPQGIASTVATLVLVIAAAIGGWVWFWRRRRLAQESQA